MTLASRIIATLVSPVSLSISAGKKARRRSLLRRSGSWSASSLIVLGGAYLICGATGAGCANQEEVTPQIPVVRGAAARAGWIGRGAGSAAASSSAAPAQRVRPARVHEMKAGEELGGPNAVGRPGDLLLENDEVAFVIDRLGSSAGFAESGGNLVDAADATTRKDELGQLFTFFGKFPRQAVYAKLTSGARADGAAWVLAEGHELYEPDLAVATRYTLAATDRAVLIETTIENRGQQPSSELALGDAVQWGGAEKVAPGKPRGFTGPTRGPFVGGVGRFASYALASTEGDLEATSGSTWTDTFLRRGVVLAPGQKVQYARVLVIGERADTASVVSELTKSAGEPVGVLALALVDARGRAVPVPEGARFSLARNGAEVLDAVAAKDAQELVVEVPPGPWDVTYAGGAGRGPLPNATPVRVDVRPGPSSSSAAARARVGSTGAARLRLACTIAEERVMVDALHDGQTRTTRVPAPCKATVEGLAGTASPNFGPAHAAGPARNQITMTLAGAEVPIAPGRYRVTLSRGPEYATATFERTIGEGETASPCAADETACSIERVVDTTGYLATDFHQHTMLGADAPVATRDRVIANAAEGVEVTVASEHNVVADLEPVVRELGLERWTVSIPGDELTTDASKKPWGHANVFPLEPDATKPRGGAPSVRDRTARDVFGELAALRQPHVLQINHPRSGATGYFDQLGFDPTTGTARDPGYDPTFDALEVWNGRNVGAREQVVGDFLALLRTGHPVTPTADTDTHGVVGQEAGYPRTYVRVDREDDLAGWNAARDADLVRGVRERRDVVLTNGPFLRVTTANGAPAIGRVVRAVDRAVQLRVHVECAPWVAVESLQVLSARTGKPLGPPRPLTLRPKGRAVAADVVEGVHVAGDDAVVVEVTGSRPLSPVLAGDPAEIRPFAMSGAVWIDADGDGASLGRK